MQFNIYNNNNYFFIFCQSTGRGSVQQVGEKGDSTVIGQIGRGVEKLGIGQPIGTFYYFKFSLHNTNTMYILYYTYRKLSHTFLI